MLHLIFKSPITHAILQRIDSGDDVVFLENTVFQINKAGMIKDELEKMLKNKIYLHVLDEELETRGITREELVKGFEIINYAGLVTLTEKNKVIRSWN